MRFILVFFFALIFTSCALKPIQGDTSFIPVYPENVNLENLGNGTVLFYNGADALHKIDNTGRLNVWINEKPFGQLKPREYAIVKLQKGDYNVKLLHIDLVNMRSEHQIVLDDSVKVIKIKPTATSNRLDVTNEFPTQFKKFKRAN